MTTLGDVCTVRSSLVDPTRPEFARLPHIAPDSIEKGSGRILGYRTAREDGVTSGKYRFEAGDVLYSKIRPNLNKVALVDHAGVCSADMYALDVDRNVAIPEFVAYVLRSQHFLDYATSLSNRANIPKLNREQLLRFDLHLPPIPEQRRLAAILDHADVLRAKRRQVLDTLDALIKSVFHDMFGDPASNPRGVQRARIGDLAPVVTGNSPSRADETNFGSSIEWIKSDNLGGDVATQATEWLSDRGRAKARIAPSGSILVTCIAGSPTSIGKASVVDRDVAFNQQINAILPSARVNSAFLLGQLKAAPDLVRAKSTGGMKGLVNKSAFQSIEVLSPPLDAQNMFASRVAAITTQTSATQRAIAAGDDLFVSLQSRAFREEL